MVACSFQLYFYFAEYSDTYRYSCFPSFALKLSAEFSGVFCSETKSSTQTSNFACGSAMDTEPHMQKCTQSTLCTAQFKNSLQTTKSSHSY